MAKKKKKKRKELPSAEAVLAGTARVTIKDLLDLIHRINPTGHDLDKEELERRYGLKSQLQSQLINQYGDQLLVSTQADQPELISLELRYFQENACHALIHELDDNARAWVRDHLNMASQSPPHGDTTRQDRPSLPSDGGDVASLLRSARQALHDYDYEACEHHLKRAIAAAPDRVDVASELMDLWVNCLAAYEQALAFYTTSCLRELSPIRVLAALAAVRSGQIETAMDYSQHVTDIRVGEVYIGAANHYMDLKDDQHASRCISLLEDLGSGEFQAEKNQLEGRLQHLYLARLTPLEEEMTAAWENGRVDASLEFARNLLNQWPANKKAEWVCREHDKQHRQLEQTKLLEQAEEAGAREDTALEVQLLSRAAELGGIQPNLSERLLQLEKKLAEERSRARREHVAGLWRENMRAKALQAYAGLDETERAELRKMVNTRHFSWLDEAIGSLTCKKTKLAETVDVVLALGDGKNAFERGDDPVELLSHLNPISSPLQLIKDGHGLLASLRTTAAAREQERAEQEIAEIIRLLDLGNWHEARIIQPNPQWLSEKDQVRLEEARAQQAHLEKLDREQGHYNDLLEQNDYLGAAASALVLASMTSGLVSEQWRAKHVDHEESLNRQWCLTRLHVEDLPPWFAKKDDIFMADGQYGCMLEDGRVLLISVFGRWLLIRSYNTGKSGSDSFILARSPTALNFPQIVAGDGVVWVGELSGFLIELQLEPLKLLSYWDFRDLRPQHYSLENVWLYPGERSLCLNLVRNNTYFSTCSFFDMDSRRETRRLDHIEDPCPINGPTPYLMAEGSGKKWLQVFDARGKSVNRFDLAHGSSVERACLHPNGSNFIFGACNESESDFVGEANLGIMLEVPSDEVEFEPYWLGEVYRDRDYNLVSCPKLGMVFVFYNRNLGTEKVLLALRAQGNRFEQVYKVVCPLLFFVKDKSFERVGVVYEDDASVQHVTILSQEPPHFISARKKSPIKPEPVPFAIDPILSCGEENGRFNALSLAMVARYSELGLHQIKAEIEELKLAGADPDLVFAHVGALRKMYLYLEGDDLEDWIVNTYPDNPRAKIRRANDAAVLSNWEEVGHLLHDLDQEGFGHNLDAHVDHLLGAVRFAEGDIPGATKLWRAGQKLENDCPYQNLMRLAEAACPPKKGEDKEVSGLRKTLRAYEKVDEHLRQERWQEAIDILQAMPFFISDTNGVLRLAQAYLALDVPKGTRQWLCKVLALGELCGRWELGKPNPYQVLPRWIKTWTVADFDELQQKANVWLAAQ